MTSPTRSGIKTFSIFKDPDSILDYQVDWSSWLTTGEVIVTSTWSVPSGLTQPFPATKTNTTATVWLGGGTVNVSYNVVNHIVTDQDREEDAVIIINMANKF